MKSGEKFVLTASSVRIGRDAECAVRVADPHASRVHAEIRREGDGWVVYDLSTNGTLVNAERVQGNRPLAHGDMVRIASESFVFMIGAESPEDAQAATLEARREAGGARAGAREARAAFEPVSPFEPPRRRESTGQTDPGEQTAFLRRSSPRGVPVWVYIGAAIAIA
ncbi:MAG: FHA domain-containing protein, partial [Gemmatimonadota bacterium]